MTQQQNQRMLELQDTQIESQNMVKIDTLISRMTTERSTIIRVDQTFDHDEEADYDEISQERDAAQEEYSDLLSELKAEIKTKDIKIVKEYLSLLKCEADEWFSKIPGKVYIPQSERESSSFSVEQLDNLVDKRTALAKSKCAGEALAYASFLERSAGNGGK